MKKSEGMPTDFWNSKYNPVTGWIYHKRMQVQYKYRNKNKTNEPIRKIKTGTQTET